MRWPGVKMLFGFGDFEGLIIGDFEFERVLDFSGAVQRDASLSKVEDAPLRLSFTLHDNNRFGNHHIWSPDKSKEEKLKELRNMAQKNGLDNKAQVYPLIHSGLNATQVASVRISRFSWEFKTDYINCVLDLEVVLSLQERADLKSPPALKDGASVADTPDATKAALTQGGTEQGKKAGILASLETLAGTGLSYLGLGG